MFRLRSGVVVDIAREVGGNLKGAGKECRGLSG